MNEVVEYKEGTVYKRILAFVAKACQFFHKGLDWDYNMKIESKFKAALAAK